MADLTSEVVDLLRRNNDLMTELVDAMDRVASDLFDVKLSVESLVETANSLQGDRLDSLKDVVDALNSVESSVTNVEMALVAKD